MVRSSFAVTVILGQRVGFTKTERAGLTLAATKFQARMISISSL